MRGVKFVRRVARVATSWAGAGIVDIMIVGAQKAGTSSLLRYLGAHPGIRAAIRPEMHCFMDPDMDQRDPSGYRDRYFGPARQPSELDLVHVGKLAGLMYEPEALEQLHRNNPGVQVVAILRDPVRRAYSAFWFARLRAREPLTSFEEALHGDQARFGTNHNSARRCEYLDRGLYAKHVERLYALFGRDQVHAIILEEFQQDPASTLAPLLRRFHLDPAELPPLAVTQNAARRPRSFRLARLPRSWAGALVARRILPRGPRVALRRRLRRLNEVAWSPTPMEAATECELRAYFAGPNRDLERLLGRDLSGLWPGPKRPA